MIKRTISFNKSDIKSFKQLDDTKYKKGSSCIICNTDSIYTIDEDVFALPITII